MTNEIDKLVSNIYEDNYSHIDFIENMNGGDCDCNIHMTLNTIESYINREGESNE